MNQVGLLGLFLGLLANACLGSQLDEFQNNRLVLAGDAAPIQQKIMDTDIKRSGMNEMNKFPSMGTMRTEMEVCEDQKSEKYCKKMKKKGKCESKKIAKKCKKTCEVCDDGKGCNESYKMEQNLICQDGNCACVICTFMLDNRVNSVKYNGVPLGISPGSAVTSWNQEKVISFQSCCDNCPGVLEINGTNSENDYHCNLAGLALRCTASRSSSPWHNFISDIDHWKVENDTIPCQGDFSIRDEIPFIAALKSFGAMKIWNNEKYATLRGSPAF